MISLDKEQPIYYFIAEDLLFETTSLFFGGQLIPCEAFQREAIIPTDQLELNERVAASAKISEATIRGGKSEGKFTTISLLDAISLKYSSVLYKELKFISK